jgi:hypothetical protein
MDTTHIDRIARFAAAGALLAATLAGCAAQASAPAEPLEGRAAVGAPRQLIPNDIDPRGLHGPLVNSAEAIVQPRMPVIADVDPRGLHGVPKAGTAFAAVDAASSAPPKNLSPVNDVDPRGLHGLPSGPR